MASNTVNLLGVGSLIDNFSCDCSELHAQIFHASANCGPRPPSGVVHHRLLRSKVAATRA
jgi:hypothetical protein